MGAAPTEAPNPEAPPPTDAPSVGAPTEAVAPPPDSTAMTEASPVTMAGTTADAVASTMTSPPVTPTRLTPTRMTTSPAEPITRIERRSTAAGSPMSAARGRGTLVVNSLPWSEVFIDGRRRGNTPLPSLPLPAGEHRIELRTADGRSHRETITISANETSRVVHRF